MANNFQPLAEEEIVIRNPPIQPVIISDINKDNILPEGRKHHIRFSFPEMSR
jgi:hypothetical protein